jgi:hypothetical protein
MHPGELPDASKLYFFLDRFGIHNPPLTPMLAARVAARRRGWLIDAAGIGFAFAVVFVLLVTGGWGEEDPPLAPAAAGQVAAFLGLGAAVLGAQAYQRHADRRLGHSWPQPAARHTVDSILGAAGGGYLASAVVTYYGGLAIAVVTIHLTNGHPEYELTLYSFAVSLVLFAVLQAVLLVEAIRRPAIGADGQWADDVIRQLDIRRVLAPHPALLVGFPMVLAPTGALSDNALHMYMLTAFLVYGLSGMASTGLAGRGWLPGGRQIPAGFRH